MSADCDIPWRGMDYLLVVFIYALDGDLFSLPFLYTVINFFRAISLVKP